MNCITNIPSWALYYLQQHNTKTRIAKTIAIEPTTIATDVDAAVPPTNDATGSI